MNEIRKAPQRQTTRPQVSSINRANDQAQNQYTKSTLLQQNHNNPDHQPIDDIGPQSRRLMHSRQQHEANRQSLRVADAFQTPVFPIEVFPEKVQKTIHEADERMHYGIDFMGCSMLFAAASAIGNSCIVEMNPDWHEGVTLWVALVGHPGAGKGHALKRALKALVKEDANHHIIYQEEMMAYKKAMSKYHRDSKNSLEESPDEPQPPILKKTILSDTTPEKMAHVHADNPRGICLHVDELTGWLQTFNRYNPGNAQKTYNSSWSRNPIIIDRINSGSIRIETPCIMVGGTIQPKILPELMAEQRGNDGFTHRILFCYPYSPARAWHREPGDNSLLTEWDDAMQRMLALPYEVDGQVVPSVLRFSDDARALLYDWQEILASEINRERRSYVKGLLTKIGQYAIRLSLIMQMIRYAYREDSKEFVGIQAVNAALKLAEYFKTTHMLIYEEIDGSSPLDDLAEDKLALYHALPDKFDRADAVSLASAINMGERSVDRFIKNPRFFRNPKRGHYAKKQ